MRFMQHFEKKTPSSEQNYSRKEIEGGKKHGYFNRKFRMLKSFPNKARETNKKPTAQSCIAN